MKYALLIYGDEAGWSELSEEEQKQLRADVMPRWNALFEELGNADPNVGGKELDHGGTAKVVRVVDGERIVTDGPYAETKEVLGGAFFIELPDLDEAIRLAALIPVAERGSIEIRPVSSAGAS
jgi:hypothetical protein